MVRTKSSSDCRRGFTLFEVLLVIAIFVLLAAMAFPFMQRSFQGQKTLSAADRVRAECGKARVSAIRSGQVYAFYYAENGNFFAVAPFKDAAKFVNTKASDLEASRFSDFDFEKNLLPRGVQFVGASVIDDTRAQMESQTVASGEIAGMTPILFYPNGESQSAEIFLSNEDTGEVYMVKVRGLTGSTSVSECELK